MYGIAIDEQLSQLSLLYLLVEALTVPFVPQQNLLALVSLQNLPCRLGNKVRHVNFRKDQREFTALVRSQGPQGHCSWQHCFRHGPVCLDKLVPIQNEMKVLNLRQHFDCNASIADQFLCCHQHLALTKHASDDGRR